MQLTDEQLKAIIAWAERTPEVEAVILYGSRYTGTASPKADVRLALVMTMKGFSGKERALNYLHNFETWEADLEAAVGLRMHLISLDPPLGSDVQSYVANGDNCFVAVDPQLAGCSAVGSSIEEAVREVQDAITALIGAAGNPVPTPLILARAEQALT
jgi:predicted RNase H-like HicB family nuclease